MIDVCIYAIVMTQTGDAYVGKSQSLEVRFREHRHRLRKGAHLNRVLQDAWDKHGEGAFQIVLLETGLSPSSASDAEGRWIERAGTLNLMKMNAEGTRLTHARCSAQKTADANKRRHAIGGYEVEAQLDNLRRIQLSYAKSAQGRERQRQNAIQRWQNPVEAAKLRVGLEVSISDPATLAKRNAAIGVAHRTPKLRQVASERSLAMWADPDKRARLVAARQTLWTPERKAARSAQGKAFYAAKRDAGN